MAIGGPSRRFPQTQEDVAFFSQEDHPRLATNLIAMLQKEHDSRAEQLVKGFPKTLEEYKYNVGIIEGLDLAMAFAKEAKRKAEA